MKRLPLAAVLAVFTGWLLWSVSTRQAALFAVGLGLGAVLAGQRFGFTTGWRMLIEQRDASGVMGQLLLLALAAALAMPLLGHYPELTAALGPPSVSLLVGAFVFGLCMQIADGCGSGTLYKAGLGIPMNAAILPLFALGSFMGSVHLEHWLALGKIEPVSLGAQLGTGGALALTLALLALSLLAVRAWVGAGRPWFEKRWVVGAVALAVLATLNLLLAGQPWGVVYGFGLWAAKVAVTTGVFEPSVNMFWSQAGNAQRLTQTVLMDVTTITNIGILAGALWVGAGKPVSHKPMTGRQWTVALCAGLLLGYSSRLAFGCNIGAMFSGISTGSIHGWIWAPMAFAGTIFGLRIRRRLGY